MSATPSPPISKSIQIKGILNPFSMFSEATPASIITIPLSVKKGGASCNIDIA